MNNIYYELMKNYGIGETKLEVVLYTLLKEHEDFRKKALKRAFRSKINLDGLQINTEVSRKGKGRTDVEFTDKNGKKYVWELKVGAAYPTTQQIDMYESIKEVVEVATLTNREDPDDLNKNRNTTWTDIKNILSGHKELNIFEKFIGDFGPISTKAKSKLVSENGLKGVSDKFIFDTYLFSISKKPGNFMNNHTGISVLENFSKYIIPSPSNKTLGKNYLDIPDNVTHLAFRYPVDNNKKTLIKVMEIKSIINKEPEDINKKLGEKVVMEKDQLKYTGPHYEIDLELVFQKELEFDVSNGQIHMYTTQDIIKSNKVKTISELSKTTKKFKMGMKDNK